MSRRMSVWYRATALVTAALMIGSLVPTEALAEELLQGGDDILTEEVEAPAEEQGPSADEGEQDVAVRLADESLGEAENPTPAEPNPSSAGDQSETEDHEASVEEAELTVAAAPSVQYSAHVQREGWMPFVADGQLGGTQGRGLRMEALKIRLADLPDGVGGGIRYRMHVQKQGWTGWAQDGQVGGTEGSALRIEALKIELYGAVKDSYDVYYRVHAQRMGWMAWASNGSAAGTAGKALRLEAVEVVLVPKGGAAPSAEGQTYPSAFAGGSGLSVRAHSQRLGWQTAVGNKQVAGTVGQGLRLEALTVKLDGLDVGGSVRGKAHVQGTGWTGWQAADSYVGSVGKGKRAEAFVFELTGEAAEVYDLYYRVHVQKLGWMGWASEGQNAGTSGMALRVEAVQIAMVSEGGACPADAGSVSEPYLTGSSVSYGSYVQASGWQADVKDGATSGVTGQSKRVEALHASLTGGTIGGGITYRAQVSTKGWSAWASDGANTSTQGQSLPLEAIQIKLTGRAATVYNVWYRVHLQKAGWLGWATNGETAGGPGLGKRIEAYQVRILPKSASAPGSTINHAIDNSFFNDPMTKKAQGYGSRTSWLLMVDCTLNKVGVYRGSKGNWQRSELITVSTGRPHAGGGDATVKGVFQINGRGYSFSGYDSMNGYGAYTCYYWTRFYGDWLFHSVLYHQGTFNISDGRLGVKVSHGCIRMSLEKAKWIHDTIPDGTTVVTY